MNVVNSSAPASPRIARKRQERMDRILRTALELARDEGRDALTLKRLGERLDLTSAALYRYFPSKDALVAELQRAVVAGLAAATRERVARAEAHAVAAGLDARTASLLAVTVAAFAFEAFARCSPVEFGLLSMHLSAPEFALPEREAAHVFEAVRAALADLAAGLERAGACGALADGDAGERALALWASLQGVMQTRKLARSAPERIDPTRLARGLVPTLLTGWGAEPARAARAASIATEEGLAEGPPATPDLLAASGR